MFEKIRCALEEASKIENVPNRAKEFDACLSWIAEELEESEFPPLEIQKIKNVQKAYCKEFVNALPAYGNSGYEEAKPLSELFLNHIRLWVELDRDEPNLLKKARPFFECIE